jgi:hypothetical protein
MTNTSNTTKGKPAARRTSKGISAAWKSGLLALSLTTVIAGTAMIGRLDSSQQIAEQPVTEQPAQQSLVIRQLPSGDLVVLPDTSASNLSTTSRSTIPTMPQQPVFRRPITRTRGS